MKASGSSITSMFPSMLQPKIFTVLLVVVPRSVRWTGAPMATHFGASSMMPSLNLTGSERLSN
ncbi:hypothetical protein SAMN05421776_1322 [Nocardia farcinica]|uniref:Uncharacterized protein n=1 Tax=Nocardia farcinica TaxID=37329 RepID=A0A0H5P476_NOCFR|nr:hypothetical protein CJ468_06245 [Nocardia farcinica]SLH54412.1 Uncharacterised protein [Mycobacteroides abscessus subsp. abscessus]PFX02154.1 hypothetical protein CJ469_02599 [Nocardia farcinica]CRY82472.1 Uncharacterised protein [Nocardia farcinica]SIT34699.1 hypothetical protein SAMN05421776_1322 [Nocardia farcinica]